ncbi:MAG TPA: MerR family DNA-binding transcriptional regulator [Stellaceae bacterium]|nr:MerR family DNA-binding transcriptional regulator [Stellaceae bacterium]
MLTQPAFVGSATDPTRLYSIGDLSGEFGVSPRAIRFYEDQGLLRPQRIGGNRVYNYRDRVRLILVLRGKRLGFSLADIKELLNLYEVDPQHIEQLRAALAKGRQRIAELERQQVEITETLKELRELEAIALARLEEKTAHGDAPAKRAEGESS